MFDLDRLHDDDCRASFRFLKNDLYLLEEVLQIPRRIICPNRLVLPGIEALCILLKRFSYPNWLGDMVQYRTSSPQSYVQYGSLSDVQYHSWAWLLRKWPIFSTKTMAGSEQLFNKTGLHLPSCNHLLMLYMLLGHLLQTVGDSSWNFEDRPGEM